MFFPTGGTGAVAVIRARPNPNGVIVQMPILPWTNVQRPWLKTPRLQSSNTTDLTISILDTDPNYSQIDNDLALANAAGLIDVISNVIIP